MAAGDAGAAAAGREGYSRHPAIPGRLERRGTGMSRQASRRGMHRRGGTGCVRGMVPASCRRSRRRLGMAPVTLSEPQYTFDTAEQHRLRVTVVAKGLNHPFSDRAAARWRCVDQRARRRAAAAAQCRGRCRASPPRWKRSRSPACPPSRRPSGYAGLHDLALHPRFADNQLVYFTFNKPGAPAAARGWRRRAAAAGAPRA